MAGLSAFLPTLLDLTEEGNQPDEESTVEDVVIKVEKKKEERNHADDSEQGVTPEDQDQDEEGDDSEEDEMDAQEPQDNKVQVKQVDDDDERITGINEKTKEPIITRGTQSSTWDQLATELVLEVVTQQVTKVRGVQQLAPGSTGCVHLDGMAWKDIVQMIVETHNKKCTHTGVTLNHHMVGMTSSIVGDVSPVKTPPKNAPSPVKKPDGRILANRPIRGRVKMRGGKVNTTNRVRTLLPNNRTNNMQQLQKNANSKPSFEAEFQETVEKMLTAGESTKRGPKETEGNHVGTKRNLDQMQDGAPDKNVTTVSLSLVVDEEEDDIDIAQCKECKRWFQSSEQLKRHSVAHATDRGPHTCEFCKFDFPTEFDLQNHMLAAHRDKMPPSENEEVIKKGRRKKIKTENHVNSDQEVFECDMCKAVVRTASGLKMHITKMHKNRGDVADVPLDNQVQLSQELLMNVGPVGNWNQKCQVCKEVFKSKMQLENHMSIHSVNNGDHDCEECGKTCRTQWNLQRHMMIHNKIKRHKCPHCDSSFGTKLLFEQHLDRVHKAGVSYNCVVDGCGAKYKNKATLKYHMLEHTGQKSFVCNFCNASFPRPDALRIHKARHKPKKFNCTLCNSAYPYRSLLIRHWQNSHWKEETVKCQYCDKVFQNYYQKNVHEFAVHTGQRLHSCPTCGKGFHQRSALAIHEKIHTGEKEWGCDGCDKSFITKGHMMRHKKVHDPSRKRLFVCSFCNMEFQYKNQWQDHENRHRGIKPHECDECEAKFTARCDLSRHKKMHSGGKMAQFACAYCDMQFKQKALMEKHEMKMHLQFDDDDDDTGGVVVFKLKK